MRRIFALFLLTLSLSCSSDDSDNDLPPDPYILEAIIGSWAYDQVTVNGEVFLYQHTDGCDKDLFQFYNQEGKEFDFEERYVSNCDICAECALTATNLKWQLNSDIIKLFFGEQLVTELQILEVDETQMRYYREFDIDDDGQIDEVIITSVPYDPYDEFD